jgi:cytoskeletal protein RodZ
MDESFDKIDTFVIKDKKYRKQKNKKRIKFLLIFFLILVIIGVIIFVVIKILTKNYGYITCVYQTNNDRETII